jgi:hypothetical protein
MIEDSTLLIEFDGKFYFIEASRDVETFTARPTNTTEPITDPEILAQLYTATRGLILSESFLYPIGNSIIDQTNALANDFYDLRRAQSLEIIYESTIEFNELLAAVVSGVKGGAAAATNSAISSYASLSNFGANIQSDAYILALTEAALQTMQDASQALIQKRFEIFEGAAPVSAEDIEELTLLTMEVVTLQQVVGELSSLVLEESEPLWTVAIDILRPWAGSALELLDASRSQVVTEVVAGWTDTITESALTVLENGPSISAAEEIFFGISERISNSVPTFYSNEEIYEASILFGFDGPSQSSSGQYFDATDDVAGTVNLVAPTFTGDGDVEYNLSLSGIGQGLQYNIAYIIDVSGSMGGQRIIDARNAYTELTNQLKAVGIADVANFAIIPFNSGSSLYADLTADEVITRLSSLSAGGGTSFGPALSNAQTFFSTSNAGQTNIAYFLSDGRGSGASDFLTSIANVQAFGIGSGANLGSLNIIDSDNAISLTSSSQLVDVLTGSGASADEIDGIAISVDGNVVDFITPDQLVDGPLGFQYTGTVSGLDISPDAQNEVTATVFLKDVDGAKGSTTLSIGSAFGDTTVTQSGDEAQVVLSAFDTSYNADDGGTPNVKLLANNLNNEIIAANTGGTFSLYDGDDYLLSSQMVGSTIDRVIDGGDGYDVVEYREEFVYDFAVKQSGFIRVGFNSDTLSNVEEIRFANGNLLTDSFTFQIEGTDDSDNLTGTEGNDEIRSYAGRYDKMFGDMGADQFIFGAETNNGTRERSVILDYEVGIDEIVLEDGASVASIRQTSSQVVIFLEGDRDAIYVRGDGVTEDNISIIGSTEDVFQLI